MNFNSYLDFFLHFHTLSFIISDGSSCLLEQERSVISVNHSEDFTAHRMFKKEVPSNCTSSLGNIATSWVLFSAEEVFPSDSKSLL